MLAPERKRLRTLEKSRKRQENYRQRQSEKGLKRLQVYASVYSHHNAQKAANKLGCDLSAIYANAFLDADLHALPIKHDEVLEGDLIGIKQLCPWLPSEAVDKFEAIAERYKTRTIAMSAVLNAYAVSVLNER